MLVSFLNSIKMLESKDRKLFFYLIILVTISAILEIFTLISIVPLINIALQEQSTNFDDLFFFKELDNEDLLTLSGFLILSRFLFSIFLVHFTNSYCHGSSAKYAGIIFSKYLNAPFDFWSKQEISVLHKNLINEVPIYFQILMQFSIVFAEIFILIGTIISIVLFLNTEIILGLTLFLFLCVLIFLICKSITNKSAAIRTKNLDSLYASILEPFSGIKFIKANQLESYFISKNKKQFEALGRINYIFHFAKELPRLTLEFLILIFLFGCVYLSLIFSGMDNFFSSIVSTSVLMIRILPSLTRINSGLIFISFYSNSDQVFRSYSTRENVIKGQSHKFPNSAYKNLSLELEDVSFGYGDIDIIKNLTFKLNSPQFVCMFGPSGSGKTSVLDLLSGVVKCRKGHLRFKDSGIIVSTPSIYYSTQETVLFDGTLGENIKLDQTNFDDNNIIKILNKLNFNEIESYKSMGLQMPIKVNPNNLSGGQRLRIGLARALIAKTDIILIDEPTASLDDNLSKKIVQLLLLEGQKRLVITTSHDPIVLSKAESILNISR